MAPAAKRRRIARGDSKTPPAWVPDALLIVRVRDGAAGDRLLDALQPAIDAFADPVIVRIATMNEDIAAHELESVGRDLENKLAHAGKSGR